MKFQELLKDEVDFSQEGYSLNFLGKNYAKYLTSLDADTVLVPDIEHNALEENKNSKNVYITGDNFDSMKHLLNSYRGEIKFIYLDPPYNIGFNNKGFRITFCMAYVYVAKIINGKGSTDKRWCCDNFH